jgi:hypothetical protein
MSNRFVSGGTINSTGESSKEEEASHPDNSPLGGDLAKNHEWDIVQQELDAERRRRDESRLKAAQGEEKSLYDILQANKGMFPNPARGRVVREAQRSKKKCE